MRLLLIVFWLFSIPVWAQVNIQGNITNHIGEALPGATITINEQSDSSKIINYAISRSDGSFIIKYSSIEKTYLSVKYIGYKAFVKDLNGSDLIVNIALQPDTIQLKEVKVKYQPIRQRGDTLSYSTASFQSQSDRVIADVLNKLPGIEVGDDGTINYEGKPIEKYYIEGLDLLEGRYNLANNNLPVDAVDRIEILENHQPIQALDSLEFSNNTSLNISLKNNVTLTGSAELAAGGNDFLWNANLTPMLFTKTKQMIGSYQTNNIGRDASLQTKTLGFRPISALTVNDPTTTQWLNILPLNNPPFNKKVWLDNEVHMVSTNYLQRIKGQIDLKINASYLSDRQNQIGERTTTFTNPIDQTTLEEQTSNVLLEEGLQSSFVIENNTKKNYLHNELAIEKISYQNRSEIKTNTQTETNRQSHNQQTLNITNSFKWVKPINNNAFSIDNSIGYYESPSELVVNPDVFQMALNNDQAFESVNQNLNYRTWHVNSSVSWSQDINRLTVKPEIGISYEDHSVQSNMLVNHNDSTKVLNGDYRNDLIFNRGAIFAGALFQYRLKRAWRLNANFNTYLRSFSRVDNFTSLNEQLDKVNFEPRIALNKTFKNFWKFNVSGFVRNAFSHVDELYSGFLLANYRNLIRYNAPILEQSIVGGKIGLNYRNVLTTSFMSISYNFEQIDNNVLRNKNVDQSGEQFMTFFPIGNSLKSHTIVSNASKFISKINTTLKFSGTYKLIDQPQLLNENLTSSQMKQYSGALSFTSDIFNWLTFSGSTKVAKFVASLNQEKFSEVSTQSYQTAINFYPATNQTIFIEGELFDNNFINSKARNYFLNFSYRYKIKKFTCFIEMRNIFNNQYFLNASNDTYYFSQSRYQLRPRQLLVGVEFTIK